MGDDLSDGHIAAAPAEERKLRRALLQHYRRHRRDLPWRQTRDPYAIWVSEIMLQQTQVDTVRPRYGEFLRRYPTVGDLAAASESEVCEAWAGLGYYRRARLLHRAAVTVVREQGGVIPGTAQELMALSGIGRYTAGAIASIAFGEEAPVVDGNVARVLARLYTLPGHPQEPALQRRLWTIATRLVRGVDPGDFNQALMELGATVCRPAQPQCERCPVRPWCRAHRQGEPTAYPAPAPAPKRRPLAVAFAWIQGTGGLWLRQRPLDGLWAGLWEPPSAEGAGAKAQLSRELGAALSRPFVKVTHELTHRSVTATLYRPQISVKWRQTARRRQWPDPLQAPLSALARKVITEAKGL